MTIGVKVYQNDGFVSITTTGGETSLAFDFPIFSASHIEIIRTRSGVNTTLAITTDYTVPSGSISNESGGTVTLVSAALAGDKYALRLNVPEERTTDFNQNGDFLADTLNLQLDLITQQTQQLRRDIERAISFSASSTATGVILPDPEANKVLGWNAAGDNLENKIVNSAAYLTVTPYMITLLNDTTAAEARTTLDANRTTSALTAVTAASGDYVSISDTSDSNNSKKALVSDIVTLAAANYGLVFISGQVASASAQIDFTSGIDGSYEIYKIFGRNILPATDDVYLRMRYSIDGGSSFLTTGYVGLGIFDSSSATNRTTPIDGININPDSAGYRVDSGAANDGLHFELTLYNPAGSSVKYTQGQTTLFEAAGSAVINGRFSGCYRGGVQAVNALRFMFSSGNIASGEFYLYGIKTS